jgi:hypothetical protein
MLWCVGALAIRCDAIALLGWIAAALHVCYLGVAWSELGMLWIVWIPLSMQVCRVLIG